MSEKEYLERDITVMENIVINFEDLKKEALNQIEFYNKRIAHRQKMIDKLKERLSALEG